MKKVNGPTFWEVAYLVALGCSGVLIAAYAYVDTKTCEALGGKRMLETLSISYECYDARTLKKLR